MDREEFDSLCRTCPEDHDPPVDLSIEVVHLNQNFNRIQECLQTVEFLMDDSFASLDYLMRRVHPPELP